MKYLYRLFILILAFVILMSMSVYAATITLGGVEVEETMILQPVSGKYSVTYTESVETELTSGQQIVVLVVKGVATLPSGLTISADTIRYIDQGISTDTSISFSNFVPSSIPNCTVLISGLTGVDGPKIVGYIEAGRVTVSGDITINGKTAGTVTLINAQNVEFSGSSALPTTSQNVSFTLPNIPIDIYRFVASKAGHIPYSLSNVDVGEFGATIQGVTLYGGDLNQNGSINVYDLNEVLIDYGKKVANALNPLSDITENGDINVYDLAELLMNYGKVGS